MLLLTHSKIISLDDSCSLNNEDPGAGFSFGRRSSFVLADDPNDFFSQRSIDGMAVVFTLDHCIVDSLGGIPVCPAICDLACSSSLSMKLQCCNM